MSRLNDIPPLLHDIIDRLQTAENLSRMGLRGERYIQKRTRAGKDVAGKTFEPYSDAYAEKRRKTGLPIHPVTLTADVISGMMRRIDHEVAADNKSVELHFTDPRKAELAYYHTEAGVAKKGEHIRKFFTLSDKEEKKIVKGVEDDLNLILQNLSTAFNARGG